MSTWLVRTATPLLPGAVEAAAGLLRGYNDRALVATALDGVARLDAVRREDARLLASALDDARLPPDAADALLRGLLEVHAERVARAERLRRFVAEEW